MNADKPQNYQSVANWTGNYFILLGKVFKFVVLIKSS